MPHKSDIILADFWGVPEKFYDNKGVSAVITGTLKGEEIIKFLYEKNKIRIHEVKINQIIDYNPRIIKGNQSKHKNRDALIRDIIKGVSFGKIISRQLKIPNKYKLYLKKVKRIISKLK